MTKKQPKLVRIDVVWAKKRLAWMIARREFVLFFTQRDAITEARCLAEVSIGRGARGVTVRIHRKDGRIREERTYPRSADPKRSRG